MYINTAAEPRAEITEFLEEARDLEKQFVAEKLAPVFTVDRRSGQYPRIRLDNGELMKRDVTLRGPTGTYNEVSRKTEWDTYICEDRGLVERIDDVNERIMKDFFDMEVLTAKLVQRNLKIDYEIRVAEMFMDPTMFNATNSTVAYNETNLATVNFPKDLDDAISRLKARAVIPNTLVITDTLWRLVKRSALLQTYLFNNLNTSGTRLITKEHITEAFTIDVIIPQTHYDNANKAKSATLKPIWTPDYFWVGQISGGAFDAGGAARTLTWGADVPNGLYATETYRDENRRSDMVRVRSHTAEKVIDNSAGELVTTQYS